MGTVTALQKPVLALPGPGKDTPETREKWSRLCIARVRDRLKEHSRVSLQTWMLIGADVAFAKQNAEKDGIPFRSLCGVEDGFPFHFRTANRLIRISEYFGTHASQSEIFNDSAPASWTTLYELTTLTPKQLHDGIASGGIHPLMERKDVRALKPKKPTKQTNRQTVPLAQAIAAKLLAIKFLKRKEWILALVEAAGFSLEAKYLKESK